MPKRRRLSDLYVVGKEIIIDDGAGDPVTVWLQKLNPVQHETTLRNANAKRASVLTLRHNPDNPEFQSIKLQALEMDRDQRLDYLVMPELSKIMAAREAELAAEEEWSKDDYLEGLRDVWEEGLKDQYAINPEDPEAKRVFDEMKRFSDEVDRLVNDARENLRSELDMLSDDELEERLTALLVDLQGDMEWVREYRRSELALAVRDPDNHKVLYFEDRSELDELPAEIIDRLTSEYRFITVEVSEGKGSAEVEASSPSPDPPSPPETEVSSGQETVPA